MLKRHVEGETLKILHQVAIADKYDKDDHSDDAKTTCGGGNFEDCGSSCYC